MIDVISKVITDLLGATAFSFASELDLQDGIAQLLNGNGITFVREVDLGTAGRIDFTVPIGFGAHLGIEVKTQGSMASVTRQMHRYACCDRIAGLLLVTTRMRHDQLPGFINDKPLRVVHLIGSAL